jgi:hypothetical protein
MTFVLLKFLESVDDVKETSVDMSTTCRRRLRRFVDALSTLQKRSVIQQKKEK